MKRRMRQGVAMLMAVLTVLSVMPVQNLYAAEADGLVQEAPEVTEEENVTEGVGTAESTETEDAVDSIETEEAVDSTESEKPVASTETKEAVDTYLLNYLVVENAYIVTPGIQNVVASVGDADINITEAVLHYRNKDTGEEYEKAVDRIAGDAMLFSISFDDANQTGIYELLSITYTADGRTNEVSLTDLGKDTVFGVNREAEAEADAYIVDEDAVEGEVVTFDENGNQTSEKSIAEAMESAISEDGTFSKTYAAGMYGAKKDFVVVLDPGHGGSDPGACRTINGINYYERDLVLKIAQFCKAELEKNGFKVYLTRTDNTSLLMDRRQRTDYAVSVGADVIVSLHINATGSDITNSATGALVYCPNGDTESGAISRELADVILKKLNELGLKNGGKVVDEGLGMILYPKEEGIPGILVEHAFINNPSDVANYLSTDEQLKALGTADAKGITEYFGMQGAVYNGVDYSAVFDFDYYIAKYPDIKAAYGNNSQAALAHFVNYGMKEGRQGIAAFDVNSYRYRYSDLRRAYGTDLKKYYMHYLTTGRFEGRAGTGTVSMQNAVTKYGGIDYASVYDYNYYTAKYPEVKGMCRDDDAEVLKYFVETGMSAGHQAKDTFNVNSYRYRYSDLRSAYGADLKKYYMHYMNYGRFEGRAGTGTVSMQNPTTKYNGVDYSSIYDYSYYSTNYPDVKKACGDDDTALIKYFVETGMKLGHRGNAAFDVNSYRYRYADLRSAYGTDLKKYYLHYMNYGRSEGRAGIGTITMQNPTTKYKGIDYSAVYDYNYYITKNPDVKKALGDDDTVVLAHFVNYGMSEGRQAKESFNVYVYKGNYADLQNAYGNNFKSYFLHFNSYGKNEGRNATTYIYTSIMGQSSTNVTQMAAYYKANATYPSYYMQNDAEAKTIEDFCRIYMEECNAEGVRAEVAFSQAMLETGFLQYKGDVNIEQYNFAGLDASGKHYKPDGSLDFIDRGRSYTSVRQGIRAHVQRLKAYAVKGTTTSSFKNTCVDPDKYTPWWTSTIVGIAPHVEWLGQNENPNGFGWATAKGYGTLIKNNMERLKKY